MLQTRAPSHSKKPRLSWLKHAYESFMKPLCGLECRYKKPP